MITISIDGQPVEADQGETVAGVLLRHDARTFRITAREGKPRSYSCGMGSCYDCLVDIDGRLLQACQTQAVAGMRISTAHNLQTQFTPKGSIR